MAVLTNNKNTGLVKAMVRQTMASKKQTHDAMLGSQEACSVLDEFFAAPANDNDSEDDKKPKAI